MTVSRNHLHNVTTHQQNTTQLIRLKFHRTHTEKCQSYRNILIHHRWPASRTLRRFPKKRTRTERVSSIPSGKGSATPTNASLSLLTQVSVAVCTFWSLVAIILQWRLTGNVATFTFTTFRTTRRRLSMPGSYGNESAENVR